MASTDHLAEVLATKEGESTLPQPPSLSETQQGTRSSKNHLILYGPRGNWKRDEDKEEKDALPV